MNVTTGLNSIAAGLNDSLTSVDAPARAGNNASPFGNILKDAIGQVGTLEDQARNAAVGLMRGDGVDVHQAVIAEQKVQMAFELALSVRNKAVQAYQSVMGMQF
jgi:flagellar hook-basal body complex protein FliE